jgi:TPR repeat protein
MGAGGVMLQKAKIIDFGFFSLLLFFAALAVILHPTHARSQSSADEKTLYERSVGDPTVKNLREYLKAFPLGDHREEVKKLLDRQMEAAAWDRAKSGNTREALTAYVDLYPAGAHVADARRMIAALDAATGMRDYPNTALNGIVSATITATSPACRTQCGERMDCAGYSVTSDNICRLFSSINSAHADSSSMAATRQPVAGYAAPAVARNNDAAPQGKAAGGQVPREERAPVTECDRLTAAEFDSQKPAGVQGVAFERIDAIAAIKACKAAVADYPREARFRYQLGRAYDKDSNYGQSMKFYRQAVDMDYSAASANLGYAYEFGVGTAVDYAKAFDLYNKVLKKGDCTVCLNLGTMYDNGYGVNTDYQKAIELYNRSIDSNVNKGQAYANLAYMYYEGQGVDKDPQKALDLFKKSVAEGGSGDAFYGMARVYDDSHGAAYDAAQAAYWYEKALRGGYGFARDQLHDNSNAWTLGSRQALQVRLHQAGVYDGPIDGSFGPMTQKAIDQIFGRY